MSKEVYFTIEKILDKMKIKDKIFYKIKWKGYPMEECTWEPLENLQYALSLVEQFDKEWTNKSKKKSKKSKKLLNNKRKKPKDENITKKQINKEFQQNDNITREFQQTDNINKENQQTDSINKQNTHIDNINDQNIQSDSINEQNIQNDNINSQNNIEEKNPHINTNININNMDSFNIDKTLKSVFAVKRQNGKLMAIVDKILENNEMVKAFFSTEELRKFNPWILLDFYESKIKFVS